MVCRTATTAFRGGSIELQLKQPFRRTRRSSGLVVIQFDPPGGFATASVGTWHRFSLTARESLAQADRIQVAINLNGYTKGARNEIFALCPAPVQTSYMGFPATTGASFLPYLITDKVLLLFEEGRHKSCSCTISSTRTPLRLRSHCSCFTVQRLRIPATL